jgi:hypothetical protein
MFWRLCQAFQSQLGFADDVEGTGGERIFPNLRILVYTRIGDRITELLRLSARLDSRQEVHGSWANSISTQIRKQKYYNSEST